MTEQELQSVVQNMIACADRLAGAGRVVDSGVMLMGVQAIKALWTQMNPPKVEEAPAPTEIPPTETAPTE